VAQQFLLGDVPDDPDVRVGRAQRRVADHRLKRLAVPGVADDRRERVALAREHLHDLGELRLDHQAPLVRLTLLVVGDLGDQTLPGGHARRNAPVDEVRVDLAHQALDVVPGRALAALAGRADQDDELVPVVP
jgi:hypothetical protein